MSDIRAQSRRDAEFDRLLLHLRLCGGCGNDIEVDLRHAYEMGKRHGREMDQEERRGSTVLPRHPKAHSDPNMAELPEVRAMTIREAFAKAGHPVPEDCRLLLEEMNRYGVCAWLCVHETGTTFHFRQLSNEWAWRSACRSWKPPFSIANLPAIDAYDALPECVQKVVKP